MIYISGDENGVDTACVVLDDMRNKLDDGLEIDEAEVEASIRMIGDNKASTPTTVFDVIEKKYMHKNKNKKQNGKQGHKKMNGENGNESGSDNGNGTHHRVMLKTHKKHITPRTPAQAEYMEAMAENKMVFGIGPAGTGKTYLAVAKAVTLLVSGQVDRIILTRPAVEAGEHLGFLPGDLKEKVDPYLRPLHDALSDMLPKDEADKFLESDVIEVAPLAFMRGRTLSNCVAILDEAQNTTPVQMKMFLTRLGENASMVITGDMSQADLPSGQVSGLRDAHDTLQGVEGISFVHFTETDVVRNKLVSKIINAYNKRDRRLRGDEKAV
ncbi:MAG: PhoH family protein [Alphaproteobacteria bacterium]|nr:PhoH family protein [Alphaproteobacteria bacterium]